MSQQSMYLMNGPVVLDISSEIARQIGDTASEQLQPSKLVTAVFRRILMRMPSESERQLAEEFLMFETQADQLRQLPSPQPIYWTYGYGRYDDQAERIIGFEEFPHFTGRSWQGSDEWPDNRLGYLLLTSRGGHPGENADQAAIRRWTSSFDGAIRLDGTIIHPAQGGEGDDDDDEDREEREDRDRDAAADDQDQGSGSNKKQRSDGIRATIVSSRLGKLGQWIVNSDRVGIRLDNVEVRPGDTIDFVIDCRANNNEDLFRWTAEIRRTDGAVSEDAFAGAQRWSTRHDFSGPRKLWHPVTSLARLVQALLQSNEFMFVD
jgi:hypothetical protein